MSSEERLKPTFRKPVEAASKPVDEQAAYFAYWELKRQQRIMDERKNSAGLSIYERAWQR